MAHRTIKSSYEQLVERLNRFPQGAPPSDLLCAILKLLFSEKEAALVSLLPIKPLASHRARAAILWLPPIHRAIACQQMKSTYLVVSF